MKHYIYISVLWTLSITNAQAACSPDQLDIKGAFGHARFNVEVVDTPETRATGLMNRASMGRSSGMLFIYDRPQAVAFWMRNTLIPLDMVFIGADGEIRKIHENAVPLDETSIPGGNRIQYVLEINGGLAREMGLKAGAVVKHPMLDQDRALWPCE